MLSPSVLPGRASCAESGHFVAGIPVLVARCSWVRPLAGLFVCVICGGGFVWGVWSR